MATYSDYLTKIATNSYKVRTRIDLLRREDETPYKTITNDIVGGNLNISLANGVRRSCDITFNNSTKAYSPDEYNMWINDKFKLYIGVLCDDGEYYDIPQGVFTWLNPSTSVGVGSNGNITYSGVDKFSLFNGVPRGRLGYSYRIPLGSDLTYSIQQMSLEFGDTISPIIHNSYLTTVTPYTIIEARGNVAKDVFTQLWESYSSNCYYDTDGILQFQPDSNDNDKSSSWEFKADDFHHINTNRDWEYDKVINKVIVVGSNINGAAYEATAENDDLASSTRISLIGENLSYNEFSNIPSVYYCQLRADYILKRETALGSKNTISSVIIPHLDVDTIIELTNEDLEIERDRNLILSINMPLGKSATTMSIDVAKTPELLEVS